MLAAKTNWKKQWTKNSKEEDDESSGHRDKSYNEIHLTGIIFKRNHIISS